MSCRTTSAGSCFTTYARLAAGGRLSDVATLSLFHELRRVYNAQPAESRRVRTREEYDTLLNRQENRINNLQDITPARRASLLERLTLARTSEMPDQSVVYALYNITPQVRVRVENMDRFLGDMATRLNEPIESLRTSFDALTAIDNRRALTLDSYSQTDRDVVSQYGLGREVGICHAVSVLNDEVGAITSAIVTEGLPRIIRRQITRPDARKTGINNLEITEAGYDIRSGRAEVLILDTATGESKFYAYPNVTEYYGTRLLQENSDNIGRWWASNIRGCSTYPSVEAERLAGVAPRCNACGQFANNMHSCPSTVEPRTLSPYSTVTRWSRQKPFIDVTSASGYRRNNAVRLPPVREFREAFNAGPVIVESISEYIYASNDNSSMVRGGFTVYKDENNITKVNTTKLGCDCLAYKTNSTCEHVNIVISAINLRLNPPARSVATARTPEERATMIALANQRATLAARTDWSLNEETLAEAKRTWNQNTEVLYSDNFDAFETTYTKAVQARKDNQDKPVIPYLKENALNGMATRTSGQGFGVEIEYEFSPNTPPGANAQIGRELFEAGLTRSASQQGYHSAGSGGYKDTHVDAQGKGNWSWERDGSVSGGELVTPTMYDEPETWEKLEKAVEILTRNGAVATKRAGGHVHVGTGFFQGSPEKYTELSRLFTQHEDVLFRLAANPERGTHRMSSYASPIRDVPSEGFADIGRVARSTGRAALNFGHVQGGASDHPEFRIFDSSLNAGAIQAHIKMSVAMTHAAARIATTGGTTRTKEILGSHADRAKARGRRKLTKEDLKTETTTLRSFIDTLFTREVDKEQIVSLFANTKWSAKRGR